MSTFQPGITTFEYKGHTFRVVARSDQRLSFSAGMGGDPPVRVNRVDHKVTFDVDRDGEKWALRNKGGAYTETVLIRRVQTNGTGRSFPTWSAYDKIFDLIQEIAEVYPQTEDARLLLERGDAYRASEDLQQANFALKRAKEALRKAEADYRAAYREAEARGGLMLSDVLQD